MSSRLSETSEDEAAELTVPPKKKKSTRGEYEKNSSKQHSKRKANDNCEENASTTFTIPKKRKNVEYEKGTSKSNVKKKFEYTEFSKGDESSDESDTCFKSDSFLHKTNVLQPPVGGYGMGEKMMKTLGYKVGEGLGKNKQGRVEPIGLSTQQGKRGLGFAPTSQGKPYEGSEWDRNSEIIRIKETPIWIDESPPDQLSRDDLDEGMTIGQEKLTIDDENEFCDPQVLDDILSLKTLFDTIPKEKLRTLVSNCNLYETIEKVFFLNRAAMKMANMDAVFDFMFTEPVNESGKAAVDLHELLYFADVCAGPGGFTEYVLWRKSWKAKGFGFTLVGNNDFKLSNMHAAPTESFFPYYGVNNDGDIFNPLNLESLKRHVLKHTEDKGVHFLMGDGGFSVEGEENIQEIKSKQLYLCQCIAALSLVREGGNFVVKLFDTFTEFSVGLIYLMYRSFKQICIHKPVTSRPANSERYLICKWKRSTSDTIERYLFRVNELMWSYSKDKQKKDITKLVPLEVIQGDANFFKYMYDTNNRIGQEQIISLLKIIECNKNPELLYDLYYDNLSHEEKKADVRKQCLEYWKIPDEKRKTAKSPTYQEVLQRLMMKMCKKSEENTRKNCMNQEIMDTVFSHQPKIVNNANDLVDGDSKPLIKSIYDWYFMYSNNTKDSKYNFYLSSGGLNVYKLEGKTWRSVQGILLPEETLIYAEEVEEKRGEGRGIHKSRTLHIIDAFSLGTKLVFSYCLKWRNTYIKLFCTSLNRPDENKSEKICFPLRCKNLYALCDLESELHKLTERTLKNNQIALTVTIPNLKENNDLYFVVDSLLFFKFCKDPWMACFSKSSQQVYYHDRSTGKSIFNVQIDSFNRTEDSLQSIFRCPFIKENVYYAEGLRPFLDIFRNLP